ncbi:gp6 [Burkholderia phage phi1026b]|uniref:Gp6 n=1 Tax=Burkholderia phage phi1026b TaxID=2881399 RepID=Q6JIM6_9CAUD|nr:hypothetical protein [Burkholderia pseudomallei]NP_945036.1 gp6 [Burkholderia phage phi1026b]AAR23157.1 gp6 [Burkholderia phage phi1026b]UNI72111.1 hypothetical protein PhiBP821_71 [Burkholderia phage PhiBP82.1]
MNNPNRVWVKPMRSYGGEDGDKSPSSAPYPVSRQRAAELRVNGLIREVDPPDSHVAAPAAMNKKAPATQNKGRAP